MEHLTILVSPEGRWVLPGTSEFFAALGDPDPDYDAVSFAVRNLGFIKFEVIRQSVVEIELHPRNVELPALLALQQQLLSSDLRLFRIKYFDDELAFRNLRPRSRRRSRGCPSCAGRISCPSMHDRFLVEPQDFGMLFEDEDNNLRIMAQKWRVSFGHFDPGIITLAMRNELAAAAGDHRGQAAPAGPGVALYRLRPPLDRRRQLSAHRCSARKWRTSPTRIMANGPAPFTARSPNPGGRATT